MFRPAAVCLHLLFSLSLLLLSHVCLCAGPAIGDPRLTAALSNYWQHDALLQLLLHAVRLLLLHGPAVSPHLQHMGAGGAADYADAAKDSVSGEGAQQAAPEEQQQQQQQRAVGLPELLEAVQQLSKVCSVALHAYVVSTQCTHCPCFAAVSWHRAAAILKPCTACLHHNLIPQGFSPVFFGF
jgi:hypothetical protein